MKPLDPTSPLPLYDQLRADLLARINAGEFRPGERIPTEHEICDIYGVSRTTARQAMMLLADDGVIQRARRRGSIVAPQWRSTPEGSRVEIVMSDQARAGQIRSSINPERNVTIDVVPYDEIHEHLMRAVAEGDAPDIAMIDHVWIAQFAENHMIYPLDELNPSWMTDLVTNDLHPSIADGYRYEGSIFAVPEEVNLAGIWYDMDALRSIGADVPTTWHELLDVAATMRDAGMTEFPITMPGGEAARETTTYCLAAMLASNGTTIMDDTVHLDSSEAVATLRLIRQFIEEGLMNPDVIGNHWLAGPRDLASGKAAIAIGGSYESQHLARELGLSESAVGDRYRFTSFPAGPSGQPANAVGGMGHVIFRQSSDPHRAMDVIETMMSEEVLRQRAAGHWTIPPLLSVIDPTSPASPFITETMNMLPNARTRPIVAGYQPVTRQLQRMVQTVISGSMRPAAAVERTAEFIGAITNTPLPDRGLFPE